MMQWISALPVTGVVAGCMIAITFVSASLAFVAGLRPGGAKASSRSSGNDGESALSISIGDGDEPHNTDIFQRRTQSVSINNFSCDSTTGEVTMVAEDILNTPRP